MKRVWQIAALVALSTVGVFAQGRGVQNEDIQFIKEWSFAEKAGEVAAALGLSDEQVAALRSIKAEVDAVKADYEPQLEAAKADMESLAASVRANIESTGEFSQEDKDALQESRRAIGQLAREMRLNVQLATVGLEDVLTEEQQSIMSDILRPNRGEGGERGERFKARRGGGGEESGRQNRRGGSGARMLLSDAFLSNFS